MDNLSCLNACLKLGGFVTYGGLCVCISFAVSTLDVIGFLLVVGT